ncbi:MAG: hypothetical protein GXO77_01555 [Calditrichaeota bacterium]|nr:hypothetical protein [Calditrichota bacterium]
MQLKFDSPGEAFVAVTLLVIQSDGKASVKELNIILKNFSSQPLRILDDIEDGNKFTFFLKTKNKILNAFEKNPDSDEIAPFSDIESKKIIESAKEVLEHDLRETTFLFAAELAFADGLTEQEKSVLEQIRKGFEIDHETAEMIMEVIPVKYRKPEVLRSGGLKKPPIQFQSVAEALIAIELAVILADEEVSIKQTSNMFWNLTLLNIFKDKSPKYYYETMDKILRMFNKRLNPPAAFNDEEVDILISACKNILDPKIAETALLVAFELAYATGLNDSEKAFIERFIQGMEIDHSVAEKIARVVPIKFRV